MKKIFISILAALLLTIGFLGCSVSVNNSVTFNNMSDSDLFVNFRGSVVSVPASKSVVVKEIPNGTYNYATTYTVPVNVTSSSVQGDVSGTLIIKAGTKIQILYSSVNNSGVYVLSATMSNSDDQSTKTTNPTGP